MTNSRPFAWDDVPLLYDLVARRWPADSPRDKMRIGEFWWTLRTTSDGDALRHMQIWPRDDGSLDAIALLDLPDAADVIVAPGAAESAFDDALDWLEAEHRAAGSGDLAVLAVAGDSARASALRRRGYAPGDRGNVRFWRALTSPPPAAPLPHRWSLRALASEDDIERRAFVEADSFGGVATAAAWKSITDRLPNYRPGLDLIAIAPDGTGASACTCWYDDPSRCGEFEAVGTAKAHRHQGIGKAVITEGLRRLHQLGATSAIVETTIGNDAAIALYRSCGFEEVARDYRWTK